MVFIYVVHTLIIDHAIGRVNRETSEFLFLLTGEFCNQRSIPNFASAWPNLNSKLSSCVPYHFSMGFPIIVHNNSLNSLISEHFTKLLIYDVSQFRRVDPVELQTILRLYCRAVSLLSPPLGMNIENLGVVRYSKPNLWFDCIFG